MATATQPLASKKAVLAVVPPKPKTAAKKATTKAAAAAEPKKKTAKKKAAEPKAAERVYPRPGSKTEKILHMLSKGEGATVDQLCKAVDWQWSAFGSTFADLKKKLSVDITSELVNDVRRYRVEKKGGSK